MWQVMRKMLVFYMRNAHMGARDPFIHYIKTLILCETDGNAHRV